jgi:hypothetical protein
MVRGVICPTFLVLLPRCVPGSLSRLLVAVAVQVLLVLLTLNWLSAFPL